MAKFKGGPAVAAASGSIGGVVFSHNRFGPYIRTRAIPTKSYTSHAQNAKARLASTSMGWGALTAAQRLAWSNWAAANPVTDALGESQQLDGHQAYVMLNTRLLAAGASVISSPPLVAHPAPLVTLTGAFDIGAGDFNLVYTATPLGAGKKLWIQAAVVNNAGKVYVQNLLRLVGLSAAAQASPFDPQSLIEARLGALSVGQKVIEYVSVFDTATGLLSAPLRVEGTVVTT